MSDKPNNNGPSFEEVALPALAKMMTHVKDGELSSLVMLAKFKKAGPHGVFLNAMFVTDNDSPLMVFSLEKTKHELLDSIQTFTLADGKRPDPNPNAQ